jgi:hypothetical protein
MLLLQREWRRGLVLEPAGDACGDAQNAAAGEGVETLTRARLEVDARPTDADKGEAIAGVDVVGVLRRNRFGVAVCSCGAFLFLLWPSWASLRSEKAHKHSSIKRKRSSTCTEWLVAAG